MLQNFDFTVIYRAGKQNFIPDMLSRLFAFEQQESRHMSIAFGRIYRNIPEVPELYATQSDNQYRLSMDNIYDLQPIASDHDLFADASFASATNVFSTFDLEKLRAEQQVEFKPNFRYLRPKSTALPPVKR